jgi:hypothetical protein
MCRVRLAKLGFAHDARRAPGKLMYLRVAVVIVHRLYWLPCRDTSVRDASSKGNLVQGTIVQSKSSGRGHIVMASLET